MPNTNYVSVDALALYHSKLQSDVLSNYVPTTRTINSKALSANITLTAADVSAVATSQLGVASGVATLDANGHVTASQLPASVDQIYEAASRSNFPETGATDVIYIALDTNLCYRWGGTTYVEISPSLALGETESTAYRGDRGAAAYTHSQIVTGNPHGTTCADLGAVPTTTTVNSKALSGNITLDASDVGAVPTTRTINGNALSADVTLGASDVGAVPTTRTINGNALSADVTLTAADVSAVPTTTKVNGHALSGDVTVTASDVGMVEASSSDINGIFS
jgi:hypothetical protein